MSITGQAHLDAIRCVRVTTTKGDSEHEKHTIFLQDYEASTPHTMSLELLSAPAHDECTFTQEEYTISQEHSTMHMPYFRCLRARYFFCENSVRVAKVLLLPASLRTISLLSIPFSFISRICSSDNVCAVLLSKYSLLSVSTPDELPRVTIRPCCTGNRITYLQLPDLVAVAHPHARASASEAQTLIHMVDQRVHCSALCIEIALHHCSCNNVSNCRPV